MNQRLVVEYFIQIYHNIWVTEHASNKGLFINDVITWGGGGGLDTPKNDDVIGYDFNY